MNFDILFNSFMIIIIIKVDFYIFNLIINLNARGLQICGQICLDTCELYIENIKYALFFQLLIGVPV